MNLAPRPARKSRPESHLYRPIMAALNKMPGVRVARNNTGALRDSAGRLVTFGLGRGSADLVGICVVDVMLWAESVGWWEQRAKLGRVFCLEVKAARQKLRPDQVRWGGVVRSLGGFYCMVTSVGEAVAAVGRCRAGESQ